MKEHHRELMGELTKVGLRPRMTQTNGSHTRIEWESGGKVHHILTSSTPSDRRATLNARARLRRQLRDQGFYRKLIVEALDTHAEFSPSLEDRVAQLELDVITLLDMMHEEGGFDAGWKAASDAVHKALDKEVMPNTDRRNVSNIDAEPARSAAQPVRAHKPKSKLLFFIPCDRWSTPAEIVKMSGKTRNAVSVALHTLKLKGVVEHDPVTHLYRKKAEYLL